MAFATELDVTGGCTPRRLTALVRELQRHDCLVRLERRSAVGADPRTPVHVEVRIPDDGYTWIVTGGFRALLADYADVVCWRADFNEIRERAGRVRSLPRTRS